MEQPASPANQPAPPRRRRNLTRWLAALFLIALIAGFAFLVAHKNGSKFAASPTWEQDFTKMRNGPPNSHVWRHELDPNVPDWNNEQQGYTDQQQNTRIENGKLVIQAHKEPYTYPNDPNGHTFGYTSGRIDTRGTFSFRYGKLEASMKLAEGDGAWPAFWLLSATNKYTKALHPTTQQAAAPGFYAHNGEIDIMENAASDGCRVFATVHTFNTYQKPKHGSVEVPNCTTTFHTYAMEWTPDKLVFSVDGKPYHTVTKTSNDPDVWPFNEPMYIILNLALGGANGGPIDPSRESWRTEIQYVRYYPYTETVNP